MPAYFIAQINVTDPDGYKDYLAGFMPIFQRHGGTLLATSGKEIEVIEGEWAHPRIVLMSFPDMAAARA